jgi:hypothetical protein
MKMIKFVVASLLVLSSCAGSPVTSSTDKTANLSQYKTYQWVGQSEAAALSLERPHFRYESSLVKVNTRPDIDEKLKPMIEEQLREAGYVKSTHGKPDFLLSYYARAKNESWISTWSGTTQGQNDVPIVIFPDFNQDMSFAYRPGNIYLVLYDPHTHSAAWTGTAFGPQDTMTLKENQVEGGLKLLVAELKKDSEKG